MDYEKILKKLKWRRDFFGDINFPMLKEEYTMAIDAIESLLKEVEHNDGHKFLSNDTK